MTDRSEYVYCRSRADLLGPDDTCRIVASNGKSSVNMHTDDVTEAVRELVEAAKVAKMLLGRNRFKSDEERAAVEVLGTTLAKFPEFREGGGS